MSVKYTAIVSGCTTTGSTSCNSNSRWLVAYLLIRDVLHLALNLTSLYLNMIFYDAFY